MKRFCLFLALMLALTICLYQRYHTLIDTMAMFLYSVDSLPQTEE